MNIIEIANVSKKFKHLGKKFFAVDSVSFSVRKGEIFGVLGPNGAGKTTLINMMIGILAPDKGTVKIFGEEIRNNRKLMERIGVSSGETRFHWALRVRDVLNFYAMIYDLRGAEKTKRIDSLAKFFGLQRIMKRKFGYLSTGERMRLTFAKALLNYPELLLLDEPTLGLDPDMAIKVRNEIRRINRKFGTTIILTSHYMGEVEQLADRIAFINRGRIVDIGTIKDLKSKHFSNYDLKIRVKVVKDKKFLKAGGFTVSGNVLKKKMKTGEDLSRILDKLARRNFVVLDVETKKPSLEDYFVKIIGDFDEAL